MARGALWGALARTPVEEAAAAGEISKFPGSAGMRFPGGAGMIFPGVPFVPERDRRMPLRRLALYRSSTRRSDADPESADE